MAVKKATVAAKSTKSIKKTPAKKIAAMAVASKAAKRIHAVKSPVVATPKIDGEKALEQELEKLLGGADGVGEDSSLGGTDPADEGGPFGSDEDDEDDSTDQDFDEDDEDEILDDEDEDEDDGCDED